MKVCVYAISKNEEKFAARWAKSMSEADEIYVLDTGSADKTVEILTSCGVKVQQREITPWRFDSARNESLTLVPEDADICVCTDIDEVFHPGWRQKLESAWKPGTTRLRYRYTWGFAKDGSETTVFLADKIHARRGYSWVNPVHEVLKFSGKRETVQTEEAIQLDHLADSTKSRAQYLPLLELAVKENPKNDRNMHYLGREYMFYGRYEDAIRTLQRHLKLPSALWRDERCASMRFIARCYFALGDYESSYKYRLLAICEAPYLREPWLEAAYHEYTLKNYLGGAYFITEALKIKERQMNYISDSASWGATPYDVLSICLYYIGDVPGALKNASAALAYGIDERISTNLALFNEKIKNQGE